MEQNSVIVGYSFLYGPVTSGVRWTVATFGRAITVTGLIPYTNYSIVMSAVISDGAMGPYTFPLFMAMLSLCPVCDTLTFIPGRSIKN